jgi:hypothetical protein
MFSMGIVVVFMDPKIPVAATMYVGKTYIECVMAEPVVKQLSF